MSQLGKHDNWLNVNPFSILIFEQFKEVVGLKTEMPVLRYSDLLAVYLDDGP